MIDEESELGTGETLAYQQPSAHAPSTSDLIASRRYDAEVGGVIVGEMRLDTGRDSQALITGAALAAVIDPAYTCNWKTAEGFVELNAVALIAIASAIRAHVQACFDREGVLVAAVAAGTYQQSMLDEGWPA